MIMKELNKYFVLLVVVSMALISFDLICYAQEKNREKDNTYKLSFAGRWDEKKAMEITKNICKKWDSNKSFVDYSINKSLSFEKDGIQKRFIQISRNGENCHFCPGLIGVVIFSESNGGWEIEFDEEKFAKFGFYGVPPEGKLIKIGLHRYGLLFQWFRKAQTGGFVHYVALIDLGEIRYNLILGEELYQKEVSQEPVIPKVEVISTTNDIFYNIRINKKIYKYRKGKYEVPNN